MNEHIAKLRAVAARFIRRGHATDEDLNEAIDILIAALVESVGRGDVRGAVACAALAAFIGREQRERMAREQPSHDAN